GKALPWTADSLLQRGHAVEARVYAEDPANRFLPQAGRLLLYREPRFPGLRIDSGVIEGDEVSVHYDPLIAKVVATAESRALAVARLSAALRDFPILGIVTNIPFLLRIIEHPRFLSGSVDTAFLDGEGAALAAGPVANEVPDVVRTAVRAHAATGSAGGETGPHDSRASDPWERLQRWRS